MINWRFTLNILIIMGCSLPAFCFAGASASSTVPTKITEVRFANLDDKSQVILSVKPATPRFKIFTLTNPNRVVIDFKNTQLSTAINSTQWKGLPIVSIRNGHPTANDLRLVIEVATTQDATMYASSANKALTNHFVIDLKRSSTNGLGKVQVLPSQSDAENSDAAANDGISENKTLSSAQSNKLVTLPPVFEATADEVDESNKTVEIKYDNNNEEHPVKTSRNSNNDMSQQQGQKADPAAILAGHVPEVYSQQLPPAISHADRSEVKPASETFQPPAAPVSDTPPQKTDETPQEAATSTSDFEPPPMIPTSEMAEGGNKPKRMITVVIDPGHGGKDPGAKGYEGYQEKNVVLAIARQLQARLNQHQGIHAVLTRKGDYYITLRERLRIARLYKADLFLAIHADAFSNPESMGSSVFALSLRGATSEAARWLAEKENYSELGGVNLGDKSNMLRSVLIDLSQTATISASLQLGGSVLQQLGMISSLHKGRVEQARFVVLKSPDIPSLLIETGFISNPREERRLINSYYQDQIASAIEEGIRRYYVKSSPVTTSFAMNFYRR